MSARCDVAGGTLDRQKKHADTEHQLVQSYERLGQLYRNKDWNQSVPDRRRVIAQQLVGVSEALLKPDESAKWRDEVKKYPESVTVPKRGTPGDK